MHVTVKLYGSLREHLPPEQRGKAALELAPDALVKDVLERLSIDAHVIVAVNEEHESSTDTALQDGDSVKIFEVTSGG